MSAHNPPIRSWSCHPDDAERKAAELNAELEAAGRTNVCWCVEEYDPKFNQSGRLLALRPVAQAGQSGSPGSETLGEPGAKPPATEPAAAPKSKPSAKPKAKTSSTAKAAAKKPAAKPAAKRKRRTTTAKKK